MKIGILKETFPGERRVALIPHDVSFLLKKGFQVFVEKGAGTGAACEDEEYAKNGATLLDREEVYNQSDIILAVRAGGANPEKALEQIEPLKEGQILIGFLDPLWRPEIISEIARKGVVSFAFELMPRITRAQSMDALSSMATIAGYRAVILAAYLLPRIFPMLITAAGTLSPAKVFVIGAGVAGLQAIGLSRKLGGVVKAYDIRPSVKEQVESVGGKFVEIPVEAGEVEDKSGYAKALKEDFYKKERELLGNVVAESDVVITTALVPGKKAPVLITKDMVERMRSGSVIVDLAAEKGGNCELTVPGSTVVKDGVTIAGPVNIASEVPYHASQMLSKNFTNFLINLFSKEGGEINWEDEIVKETLLTKEKEIVNERVKSLLEKE